MDNTIENTNIIDTQTRKWLLTINNPVDKGYSHDKIKDIISNMSNVLYYCLSDEIGEQGTYHTHLFICFASARKFSTMKNAFSGAHFDVAKGTCSQNRDYVFKEGKWLDDKKGETNLRDSHFEYGEMPVERQGKRNDLHDLYDMIKCGMSNVQILDTDPSYIIHIDRLDKIRQELLFDKFRNVERLVNVTYVFGETGTGKTYDVMHRYGYDNIYRVTDYKHPFDNYSGQDVLVLDEYRSQFPLWYILDILDKYPLQLSSRYTNKCACFTKVYIISNIPLSEQYKDIKSEEKVSYNAFLRRIHRIEKYSKNGIEKYTIQEYLERPRLVDCSIEDTPFYVVK